MEMKQEMEKLEVKPLDRGRILIFNFAGLLITLGAFLLLWLYILAQHVVPFFLKILSMIYLVLCPVFLGLVVVEDIIFFLAWLAKSEMRMDG